MKDTSVLAEAITATVWGALRAQGPRARFERSAVSHPPDRFPLPLPVLLQNFAHLHAYWLHFALIYFVAPTPENQASPLNIASECLERYLELGWSVSNACGIFGFTFSPDNNKGRQHPTFLDIAWLFACVKMGAALIEPESNDTIFHFVARIRSIKYVADGVDEYNPSTSPLIAALRELLRRGREAGLSFLTPNLDGITPVQLLLVNVKHEDGDDSVEMDFGYDEEQNREIPLHIKQILIREKLLTEEEMNCIL
jgi:hypothetical protein